MGIWPRLEQQRSNIAYVYALVGNTSLALFQICFKSLTFVMSPLYILFLRAFLLFTFNSIYLNQANKSAHITNPGLARMMLMRVVTTSVGSALLHFSYKYLPLSIVSTLYSLNPIFIYFIQAAYFKKPFDRFRMTLTVICFFGVLLILQPEFLFGTPIDYIKIPHFYPLCGLVLLAVVSISMAFIFIHDTAKRIDSFVNLHYTYMGHMAVTSMIQVFHHPTIDYEAINLTKILIFIAYLFFGWASQLFVYEANRIKKPSKVTPFSYITIIASFIADLYIFGTSYNFIAIVGIILTSSGLLGKYLIQRHQNKMLQAEKVMEK